MATIDIAVDTLKVAEALAFEGFCVWTPKERKTGRRPRTHKPFDKTLPIMPTYVFADAGQIDELRALSERPSHGCPQFSIFKYSDGFPLVADVELGTLAFWPPGNAFCIFYGRTPASTDRTPRAASPVNVVGVLSGDAARLRGTETGTRVTLALAD